MLCDGNIGIHGMSSAEYRSNELITNSGWKKKLFCRAIDKFHSRGRSFGCSVVVVFVSVSIFMSIFNGSGVSFCVCFFFWSFRSGMRNWIFYYFGIRIFNCQAIFFCCRSVIISMICWPIFESKNWCVMRLLLIRNSRSHVFLRSEEFEILKYYNYF